MRNYFLVLLGWLVLAPGLALAQPCTPDQLTEAPYHFGAFIPNTNTELPTSLCVGQPVELRLIPPSASATVFYAVNPGTGLAGLPNPCNGFTVTSPFTPTAAQAGPIVITANINLGGGMTRLVYYRSYTVNTLPVPTFTLAPCSNNQALVTVTGPTYPNYTVQVGSGPETVVTNPAVPFSVPAGVGSTVTLRASYTTNDPCVGSSTQTVRVLPLAVPPVLSRLTLSGPVPSAATLEVSGVLADYKYTVLLDNQPLPAIVPPPTGSSTVPVPTAAAGNYRLARADVCGTSRDTSAAIHTLALTGTATSGHNILRFDYGTVPPLSFRVERDGVVLAAALPPTAPIYDDSLIVCGTPYSYKVTAVLSGGRESVNDTTLRASAGPVPMPRVTASFALDNVVELTSFLPAPSVGLPTGSHPHFRRNQGTRVVDVGTTRGTAIVRDAATLDSLLLSPPCYTARLTDTCSTVSLSGPPTCPALLRATLADANGYTVQLDWNAFQGPDPSQPRQDTLLSITADGNILSKVPVTGLPPSYIDTNTPTDRQTLRYRLKSTGAGLPLGAVSYSNVAEVTRQSSLVIPTAFTPNGDNLNDVLELKGRFLSNFTFIIVDRNGREAFRSTNRNDSWDGRIGGHAPVNGAYVWRFHQTDETGKTRDLVGTVTILQ